MKTLTIREPYASLIALGIKAIETRDWFTSYRGPLAIHAAKGMTVDEVEYACELEHVDGYPLNVGHAYSPTYAMQHTRGKVIATATLAECVRFTRSETYQFRSGRRIEITTQEYRLGDFTPGRYGWVLTDVVRLPEPIPAKGSLGLWDWEMPEDLASVAD